MRLKRLELYGYKSFASRTVFDFDGGITAIVGPNGSGKSNIADAVRWVMGEQSYTSMRAKTTEDMIFAGSKNRARLGMAEVILLFDNTTHWLPLDFDEVSVGRRAFRSGENEYLLNNTKVRYRDILDLFGGAGLAKSNYTVIGQGMVDAVLALRPEARRGLFEEAAGVTPQLRKREETLQRIAETERNLQRVADIAHELEPRVRTLQHQAERAQEQLILRQDLHELQRIWYGFQWQNLAARIERADHLTREHQLQLDELRKTLHKCEEQHNKSADELVHLREELDGIRRQHTASQREFESVTREAAVYAERLRLYESQNENLRQEIKALSTRRDVVQTEVEKSSVELADQEAALQQSQVELQEAKREQAQAEALRRELTRTVAMEQNAANKLVAALSDIGARLEQAVERCTVLEKGIASSKNKIDSSQTRAVELRNRLTSSREQEEDLRVKLSAEQSKHKLLAEELQHLQENASTFEQQRRHLEADLEALVAKREMQARLHQELSGYQPGVREVLSPEAGLSGLLGTAASLMTVTSQYEVAIESALGPRLQNVVAEKWADAEAAINHLKATGGGWATFLPLDTLRPHAQGKAWHEPGVVGIGSALVKFDERLRPVYELLLGTVLVVENLATARRLLSNAHGISLIVTLGGETVQPSGALSGGIRRNNANLLAQERQWREFPAKIAALEKQLKIVMEQAAQANDQVASAKANYAQEDSEIARIRADLDMFQNQLADLSREVREAEAEVEWQTTRQRRDISELDSLTAKEGELRSRLAESQQGQVVVLEKLRLADEKLAEQDDRPRQRLAALETRVAVVQRTVHSQRTLINSHKSSLEQLQAQIQQKNTQSVTLTQSLAEQQAGYTNAVSKLNKLNAEKTALEARITPTAARITELEQHQQADEQERIALQNKIAEATLAHERALLELGHLKDEQHTMQQNLEGDLGPILPRTSEARQLRLNLGGEVVLLSAVPVMPAGLEEQIKAVKSSLKRLGEVNPNAPAEYAEANDRLEFLHTQDADLRNAIESLHKVIKELDQLIDTEMQRTFKQVQRAFKDYFILLFNGGSAELQLTEPDNFSETGIDISVRPPGKRTQNLSLLSGGERALTAVALLFALLQANPVPFCFLDEVDAALDEANIFRFRDLLKRHALGTQFIVITHNRRTIEAATSIYGVAMGEQGVSQVISLKVSEVPEEAAQPGAG
ncbi:MAG: chromosome segregation protein SMC [Chloroflexi bacterium]|nr:chromosome segregation protein SMC [Chloroflexota bacterium]